MELRQHRVSHLRTCPERQSPGSGFQIEIVPCYPKFLKHKTKQDLQRIR